MKVSELKNMIRQVVAEEVAKQLPLVISELYLRQLVEQNVRPHKRVEERLNATQSSAEDEDLPKQEFQDDRGIYSEVRRVREEMKNELLNPETNPMASLYENVRPLERSDPYAQQSQDTSGEVLGETQQKFGSAGVPLSMLGLDFNKMNSIIKPKKTIEEIPDDHPQMREIMRRRAALEKKADTGR